MVRAMKVVVVHVIDVWVVVQTGGAGILKGFSLIILSLSCV